jgi:ABC-2 type transport system permease protein
LSGTDTVFADLREQALANTTLPEDRRRDLGVMFDSIAKVQGPVAASGPAASAPVANTSGFTMPYATREEEAGVRPEQKYNSYSHAFVGMSVQFVLLMGVDIGIGLLAMRRLGLWKRLRAAPLSRGTLLASRIASAALIAMFSMAVVFAAAIAAFGVRIDGSVAGFVGVLLAFALMTASFGLLIAAIGRTPEATRGLAILVTLLLVMLGGAWVPSFLFPDWVQKISLLVPTRWAVDGLDAMTWRGLPLSGAALPIAVLLGFTAVFAALALWRFEWDE